jgi:hypothetical protein
MMKSYDGLLIAMINVYISDDSSLSQEELVFNPVNFIRFVIYFCVFFVGY